MKTNEFIKEAEAMGYYIAFDDERLCEGFLYITKSRFELDIVGRVSVEKIGLIDTCFDDFLTLNNYMKQRVLNLLTQYASTPVEEREEEKEYMYRVKKVDGLELNGTYVTFVELNSLSGREGYFILDYLDDRPRYKQVFTHSWLKKHGVDIEQLKEVCDEIEVEED